MARILVIEDELGLQKVLEYNLRQAGHEVVLATRGRDGILRAHEFRPDLVLLDLMLPDISGTDVVRALQKSADTKEIPVIIVTARGDEVDRIVGFELGAADYVVKPFSVRELVLRVQAILRRVRSPVDRNMIEFGCLRIDEDAHRVFVDNREVELTLLEYKLLIALYENRSRVQTRGGLLDGVWGIDVGITSRTVDTHVKRLRDKLGRAGDYIETVRGIGYRFADDPSLPEISGDHAANGD
jgi:two-component system phosphate regulon response regulator PhoB